MATTTQEFWTAVQTAINPALYKPVRNTQVEVVRLESWDKKPYYVLKEPVTRSYLRLSEPDYAVWWQMDGRKTIKDLLYYNLVRYKTLPIGHLNRLVQDLREGNFLQDPPTRLYDQIEAALATRAPASRGRRILDAFLHAEWSIEGLNDFFSPLYDRFRWLFTWWGQLLLLLIIFLGGGLYGLFFWQQRLSLTGNGVFSIATIIIANLVVIGIHELAHGLTTKHFGREIHRGGFLIYWGMPAFFVDTRDTWMLSRWRRIMVSWAGPHSGLVVGGVSGLLLTAVSLYAPYLLDTFWLNMLYQMGFLAYLSVFVNLNPLLELDGYFILMDWLDMPGLRERAFQFWRRQLWGHWRENKSPLAFWRHLSRSERVFTFYGGLALVYSAYALVFSLYFWQTRLSPLVRFLWQEQGVVGKLVVLLVTAVLVVPGVYYLLQYGWNRIRAMLEWLARRDLLGRIDVLTLLTGLVIYLFVPSALVALSFAGDLWLQLGVWLVHLAAIGTTVAVARQLPGSRFQWALWSLTAVPLGLTIHYVAPVPFWQNVGILLAGGGIFAAAWVGAFTIWPHRLTTADRLFMFIFLGVGTGYGVLLYQLSANQILWADLLILLFVFGGLILLSPLLVNFSSSRFGLPWLLVVLGILVLPWIRPYPFLQIPLVFLWLHATFLYWLAGALAEFSRLAIADTIPDTVDERKWLISAFNHFIQAMFASYEPVFGGRRLRTIQAQMLALGPIDIDESILTIADRCRRALLLAVDRLDDLAGTPFTRKVGQAAYDSLPWLEAETLSRHVLAEMDWGTQLAQGFIIARDHRAQLVRQADIFAGFDQEGVQKLLQIARTWKGDAGVILAHEGEDARHFYLIESGEVGVFLHGEQMATLTVGGYFGMPALLDEGEYLATYKTLTPVQVMVIDRERFDPLWRADTALAQQVSVGSMERDLLKRMPLFDGLSPQQITAVARRLKRAQVPAGRIIVRQGQPRSHLVIIAEGIVEVILNDNGGQKIVGQLGPGEHFGEYALFADLPYQATYRAATDVTILLLDEPTFDRLVAECEMMSHYVEQIGTGRLYVTRRRLGINGIIS
ncbi:MAG: hypothetical protein D6706_04025 [Chloroflexi bacterium]|nr:MAG: hypothetical protein D6706_04025 [Chloroflexota bacterium]